MDKMARFDDFDLDVNVNKGDEKQPRVFSISACTPGTCHDGCHGDSTMYSNCCELASEITKMSVVTTTTITL
ncbi:hypothetical protein CF069_20130 [Clostridium botulinum]